MSGSIQTMMLGGALLAWCAVVYKGQALWRYPANPASWAYWAGFLALALTMTLLMPPVTGWIDGTAGITDLSYLIGDAAALLTCWSWLVCLYQLNKPDRQAAGAVRWFGALVVTALAFFSLRFSIAPGQVQHRLSADPQGLYLAAYRLIFVGIIAAHMAYFIVLLRRYAAEAQRPTLRLRLHFMTVAAGLIIGFALNESLRILRFPSPEVISAAFALAAVLAMVVGLTFGHRLDRLYRAARQYRLYLRLYPLWRALYPLAPDLSFLAAPSLRHQFWPRDDLGFVICRQVIEIRDWAIALHSFQLPSMGVQDDAREAIGGRYSVDREASDEASQLVAALRSWQDQGTVGEPGDRDPAPAVPHSYRNPPAPDTTDWRQEARHLARVAQHFVSLQRASATLADTRRNHRGIGIEGPGR